MTNIKLGDLCKSCAGQIKVEDGELIDYIDISSIDNEKKKLIGFQTMPFGESPSRARKVVKKGSILVSTVRPNLNAIAVLENDTPNISVASTGFCILDCKDDVDNRFVFNFCKSRKFIDDMVSKATGASYPAVSDKIIRSALVPNYTYEEQCNISKVLDSISDIIDKREAELFSLDELIKARFVELFGFPGTDEKGWGLRRLGECCEINPKKVSDKRLASGMQVSFVPMTAVSENGAIKTAEKKTYDEVKVGFTYFAENDVLFAKITPCMENGKGAVAVGLCNGIGFGSTEFHVLRPINGKSNPYWLYSLISFDTFRKDAATNMTGSAGQRRVPSMFLEKYKITLPPFELQNQFADFVHQVDKSKVAVQKALDETQLLFDSLMQQYFE